MANLATGQTMESKASSKRDVGMFGQESTRPAFPKQKKVQL